MPKVSEEHRNARREQILEAAINCFSRNGFHQTSMKDIFKEARLSAGAVYLHFSSKEDIIEACLHKTHEARQARFKEAMSAGPTIQVFNEFWIDFEGRLGRAEADKGWQLWLQLLAEAIRNPRIKEIIRGNWDDAENQLVALLRQADEKGVVNTSLDYDVYARLWQVVHDGFIIMKLIDHERNVHRYFEAYKEAVKALSRGSGNIASAEL